VFTCKLLNETSCCDESRVISDDGHSSNFRSWLKRLDANDIWSRPVESHRKPLPRGPITLTTHRRRKKGQWGLWGTCPFPKKSGIYFSGNYRVKFGHFRENITNITNIIRLRVWGSVVRSPSGVRGRAPAENGFYAYFRSERSHLEHPFQYF